MSGEGVINANSTPRRICFLLGASDNHQTVSTHSYSLSSRRVTILVRPRGAIDRELDSHSHRGSTTCLKRVATMLTRPADVPSAFWGRRQPPNRQRSHPNLI
jgi:hypothetical protein